MELDARVADQVDVLLVIPDRRLRAYALAELLEQGYEVIAVPRPRHARALLRTGVSARLLVVDLAGLAPESDVARDLLAREPEGLLALGSALERSDVAHLPSLRVLIRPFTVGQLVERIRRLLEARHERGSGGQLGGNPLGSESRESGLGPQDTFARQ